MANEIQPFNYGEVEPATAEKLKRHAAVIKGVQSKAIYEIGEELQAAHDELANHRNGTFFAWCESIGIKSTTAKEILSYHDFISRNASNKELLESLPKRLIVDANRPSTPQELKDKVASGDVTTLPEFKKLKAELEATKNVLRTTETKLDEKDAEIEEAEKRAHAANLAQDVALTKQCEYKESLGIAEAERDEAKAEADQLREKARAYDDLQQMNHTLREKLREKDEELLNRPERETVVTKEVEKRVEVIPDEYKKAFMENQKLRKELATYKAHQQNRTLQELAEIDKDYEDLKKSDEEEEKVSERMEFFKMLPVFFPEGPIEAREVWRCFLKHHGHEDPIVKEVCKNIKRARDAMVWLDEAAPSMGGTPKLERVK